MLQNMVKTQWLSVQEWHSRMVAGGRCDCRACKAERAAAELERKAAVARVLESIDFAPVGYWCESVNGDGAIVSEFGERAGQDGARC